MAAGADSAGAGGFAAGGAASPGTGDGLGLGTSDLGLLGGGGFELGETGRAVPGSAAAAAAGVPGMVDLGLLGGGGLEAVPASGRGDPVGEGTDPAPGAMDMGLVGGGGALGPPGAGDADGFGGMGASPSSLMGARGPAMEEGLTAVEPGLGLDGLGGKRAEALTLLACKRNGAKSRGEIKEQRRGSRIPRANDRFAERLTSSAISKASTQRSCYCSAQRLSERKLTTRDSLHYKQSLICGCQQPTRAPEKQLAMNLASQVFFLDRRLTRRQTQTTGMILQVTSVDVAAGGAPGTPEALSSVLSSGPESLNRHLLLSASNDRYGA